MALTRQFYLSQLQNFTDFKYIMYKKQAFDLKFNFTATVMNVDVIDYTKRINFCPCCLQIIMKFITSTNILLTELLV